MTRSKSASSVADRRLLQLDAGVVMREVDVPEGVERGLDDGAAVGGRR